MTPKVRNSVRPKTRRTAKWSSLYVQAVSQGESKIIVKLEGRARSTSHGADHHDLRKQPAAPVQQIRAETGWRAAGGAREPAPMRAGDHDDGPHALEQPVHRRLQPVLHVQPQPELLRSAVQPDVVTPAPRASSPGEYSPFTLVFGRSDNEGFLAGLQEPLPPGLLGEDQGCDAVSRTAGQRRQVRAENSLVGHVQALTGPGADPFLVTNGKVYLTGRLQGRAVRPVDRRAGGRWSIHA